MRRLLLLIACLFWLGAVAVAAVDLVRGYGGSGAWVRSAGEWWYVLSPSTLNGLQAGIQRYVSPDLWEHVISPALLWPAVAVLILKGAFFWVVSRLFRRP